MRVCGGMWIAHGSGNADRKTVDLWDHAVEMPAEERRRRMRRMRGVVAANNICRWAGKVISNLLRLDFSENARLYFAEQSAWSGVFGTCVTDNSWCSTTVRALPNSLIIIPNPKLAQAIVTNYHLLEKRMSVWIEVRKRILKRFREGDIKIPYLTRSVYVRGGARELDHP